MNSVAATEKKGKEAATIYRAPTRKERDTGLPGETGTQKPRKTRHYAAGLGIHLESAMNGRGI
jgi:hypothetical protein